MGTLAQQNIGVFVTDPKDLDGVYRNLEQFGEFFGTTRQAAEAVENLRGRETMVRQGVSYSERFENGIPVFVQISNDPLFTIGKDSFLTKIIRDAGGNSVTKDVPTGYPKLSKETALALNPDVIILSDSEDNKEPNVVFRNSPAVKNGRVYRINADIISRPGPRLVDAMEEIAKAIEPPK
jgi:iron complex transport system substrate-binding protein